MVSHRVRPVGPLMSNGAQNREFFSLKGHGKQRHLTANHRNDAILSLTVCSSLRDNRLFP
jgi:hypothetical protein